MKTTNKDFKPQEMTFNPSVDLRSDLIKFYGYTNSQANNMSDDEVFAIIDAMEYDEECDSVKPLINFPCAKCNHDQMYEMDFSDWDDKYTLQCPNCNHEVRIHYTVYDAHLDE